MTSKLLKFFLLACFCLLGTSSTGWAQEDADHEIEEYTIPEGTEFKMQLHTKIHSKTSKTGDRVLATLIDPVYVEDREVLAKGLRVGGSVQEVRAAGRKGRGGYISIIFDTVELANGEKIAIMGSLTEVFSVEGAGDPSVGAEGELKGRGASTIKRLIIAGGAAGAGAAGGLGPGIAAAATGTVLAIVLPKGQEASLGAGSLIGMRLDRDATVTFAPASR